ncbi:MAG: hypothetical protein JXQ73_28740 [Phycisphaerae bacterium]|nr:hypothetical protein [Phycisphaerae bacterium]
MILASHPAPNDVAALAAETKMAEYLCLTHFEGWTNAFGVNLSKTDVEAIQRGRDQFDKARAIYEHIVKHYSKNEYRVLLSMAQLAGMISCRPGSSRDDACVALGLHLDVYLTPVERVVDSIDPRGNVPPEAAGGRTPAQARFERLKQRVYATGFAICKSADEVERYVLLGIVKRRCSTLAPEVAQEADRAIQAFIEGDLIRTSLEGDEPDEEQ